MREQEWALQVRMEVHHQPAFLSGGGGAENPGENYIQAIGIVKKKYFNFFFFFIIFTKNVSSQDK